jgi:hypothetical protein
MKTEKVKSETTTKFNKRSKQVNLEKAEQYIVNNKTFDPTFVKVTFKLNKIDCQLIGVFTKGLEHLSKKALTELGIIGTNKIKGNVKGKVLRKYKRKIDKKTLKVVKK